MARAALSSPFYINNMDIIKLPPRLALLASLVPTGAAIADVGSDHGLLPIHLLQSGRIVSAVATDINAGPISRAKANAAACGVENLRCVQCDGLAAVSPQEVNTIVIAGMGGETIDGILRDAPWARERCLLLLQPMSRPEELRRGLAAFGMRIEAERLVLDSGRIYAVLQVRKGTPDMLSEAEEYIGSYTLISKEPLFKRFLEQWNQKFSSALEGVSRSTRTEDQVRTEHLKRVLTQIEEVKKRYADCS